MTGEGATARLVGIALASGLSYGIHASDQQMIADVGSVVVYRWANVNVYRKSTDRLTANR
jgi:hypothetical protein